MLLLFSGFSLQGFPVPLQQSSTIRSHALSQNNAPYYNYNYGTLPVGGAFGAGTSHVQLTGIGHSALLPSFVPAEGSSMRNANYYFNGKCCHEIILA